MKLSLAMLWVAAAATIGVPLIAVALDQHAALRKASADSAVLVPSADVFLQRRDIVQRLRDDAAAMAVSLKVTGHAPQSGLTALNVDIVGPQSAVVAFAERIETRPPALRFSNWTVAPTAGGVRLTATVAAPAGAD